MSVYMASFVVIIAVGGGTAAATGEGEDKGTSRGTCPPYKCEISILKFK